MRAFILLADGYRFDFGGLQDPTQSLPDDKLFCPSAGLHISEETAKFYLEDAQGDLKRAYQLHRECLSLCKTCGASLYLPE